MTEASEDALMRKLDDISDVLRHILAIELAREGVSKADIGKHLHVAKATVVTMLKGVKRGD